MEVDKAHRGTNTQMLPPPLLLQEAFTLCSNACSKVRGYTAALHIMYYCRVRILHRILPFGGAYGYHAVKYAREQHIPAPISLKESTRRY